MENNNASPSAQISQTPNQEVASSVCPSCKFEPGKTINVIEKNICPTCKKEISWLNEKKEEVKIQEKQKDKPNLNKGWDGGRPTKYHPDMVAKVDEYINWAKMQENHLIGKENFAIYLGVTDVSLWGWANKKKKNDKGELTEKLERPEFFNALKRLEAFQKAQLMDLGVFNKGSSIMSIFLLKANHGLKEVEHIDHTTAGEKISQVVGFDYVKPNPEKEDANKTETTTDA